MLELDDVDSLPPEVAAAVAWHDLAAGEFTGPLDDGTAILAARAVRQALTVADSGGIGVVVIPYAFRHLVPEDSPAWDPIAARCLQSADDPATGTLAICVLEVDDHPDLCPIDVDVVAVRGDAW